ncbi:MAG TPA: recombinase family protein, partial [Acidobacteriaceae bacterium]|nr:recombinase family protein [Acidobacteriaceae bacterium]
MGGAFLANMLADWIDGDRQSLFSVEAADEYHDQRTTAEQDRLCVCAPVDPGCYNPADFNDGLLLGLKGTMAQAELHLLRGRLLGGKLNKARKGELHFPLPVGLCYDEEGRIVLDPDEEVRGAVELIFRLFRETGSAFAVMQQFAKSNLRFPKRSYGGAWGGKLIWGQLSHSRVLNILKNPSYAGMYVFGRYQYRRQISPTGEV